MHISPSVCESGHTHHLQCDRLNFGQRQKGAVVSEVSPLVLLICILDNSKSKGSTNSPCCKNRPIISSNISPKINPRQRADSRRAHVLQNSLYRKHGVPFTQISSVQGSLTRGSAFLCCQQRAELPGTGEGGVLISDANPTHWQSFTLVPLFIFQNSLPV